MPTNPYDRPSDPAKRHSAALTDGPDRAAARAMLKAIGFTDDDLAKPIVGVATTWIETMPCNFNQRKLAQRVKAGIRDAGGRIDAAELHEVESSACPGAGACGGQYTANTMSMALDFLGISPAGLNGIPALNRGKGDAAEECGRLAMKLVREDIRPSHIITREAIENAAASVAAAGGSTNGVLHLLAIAHELGIPFSIDEFDSIAARPPVVASLKPGG